MAIKIKYFNSFVLKKLVNNDTATGSKFKPVFPGLQSNPTNYPAFSTSAGNPIGRTTATANNTRSWIIEEARIRGDFNATNAGYGARAYLIEDDNEQSRRINALIYSGIYNSATNVNNTNVFSIGEDIEREVDPMYGSIQKLHALDSNMAILQENKISRALIDKDTIYTTEQGSQTLRPGTVIGQITPYVGEYGISKNPETFAYYGYRRYFVDKYRNAVMRLSRDGVTPISDYGMVDYFRDELDTIEDQFKQYSFTCVYVSVATSPFRIVISGDNKTFIEKGMEITIPQASGGDIVCNVVGIFNETFIYLDSNPGTPAAGNVTFKKYIKDRMVGGYDIHNQNYVVSTQQKATSPSGTDTYNTLAFEDSINGWVSFYSYEPLFMSSLKNKYFSFYGADIYEHYDNITTNSAGSFYGVNSTARAGEVIYGKDMSGIKGYFATVKISTDETTQLGGPKELFSVSSRYALSSY
jgi:hypothetical protein